MFKSVFPGESLAEGPVCDEIPCWCMCHGWPDTGINEGEEFGWEYTLAHWLMQISG